ncbi:MAG: MMPL family transporter, partial [Solirubrobacteraceae bacterium]
MAPATAGGFVGVTGAIAARAQQADVIEEHLPLVDIATLLLVLAAVGLYFRSILAPLINLVTVALANLISIRLVATLGKLVGVSVPGSAADRRRAALRRRHRLLPVLPLTLPPTARRRLGVDSGRMSVELLDLAADTLGELLDEVVFVGGATVVLWITDPGAPPVRP